MPKLIGDMLGQPVHCVPVPNNSLILPYGKVGIEIETEGWRGSGLEELGRLWNTHDDGSLRNNGKEFVTSGNGLVGEDIIKAIDCFVDFAKKHKLSEGYPRAGIHVHLDCTDLDIGKGELSNLVGIYLIIEHALYGYAGMWRRYCGFCDALTDSQININALKEILNRQDISPSQFRKYIESFDRYTGLNLKALRKYGTIEFRHMRTVYDKDIIKNWINLIFQIKSAAQNWDSGKSLLPTFSSLGPTGFAAKVMGAMWRHIEPFFDETQAWAAIDSSITLMDTVKLAVPTKDGKINWDEPKPNPILAKKLALQTKPKKVKPAAVPPPPRRTNYARLDTLLLNNGSDEQVMNHLVNTLDVVAATRLQIMYREHSERMLGQRIEPLTFGRFVLSQI